MTAPQLQDAHTRLAEFAGTWEGEEQLSSTPWAPAGTAEGRHVFRLAAGGFALVQDYDEVRDGRPALTGHGVFSVDPDNGQVLWHWFDSIGYPPLAPSRGAFDAARLELEKTTPRGVQRATFALQEGVLVHTIEVKLGDRREFETILVARYERVDPAQGRP